MDKQQFFEQIKKSVIEGNKEEAVALAKKATEEKLDLNEVIEKGYVPAIQEVGDLWEKGEYFLPELITSAECKHPYQILRKSCYRNGRRRHS